MFNDFPVCKMCGSSDIDCGSNIYALGDWAECMECGYSGRSISAGDYHDRQEFNREVTK